MRIEGNSYYIENKLKFNSIHTFKKQTISTVFNFAYEMSFGKGEHRQHRSGGQHNRKNGEIFINAFQGKLAELGIYNFIYVYNKRLYKQLTEPDFEVYELGKWDSVDISSDNKKFSIKSTKHYGNLLLLETKDWNDEALYIPNLEKGNGYYDYTILVRINPDGENIMKANKLLYADIVDKEKLREVIFNELWSYDVPGYITNSELKILIEKQQIIPQNALLNGKITMDAENYYEETGNLNDCRELIKNII